MLNSDEALSSSGFSNQIAISKSSTSISGLEHEVSPLGHSEGEPVHPSSPQVGFSQELVPKLGQDSSSAQEISGVFPCPSDSPELHISSNRAPAVSRPVQTVSSSSTSNKRRRILPSGISTSSSSSA